MAWLWSADPQLQLCKTSPWLGAFQPLIPKVSSSNFGWLHQASWWNYGIKGISLSPCHGFVHIWTKKTHKTTIRGFPAEETKIFPWQNGICQDHHGFFSLLMLRDSKPQLPHSSNSNVKQPLPICLLKICLKCILIFSLKEIFINLLQVSKAVSKHSFWLHSIAFLTSFTNWKYDWDNMQSSSINYQSYPGVWSASWLTFDL